MFNSHVGRISLDLVLNNKSFNRQLDNVNTKTQQVANKLSAPLRKIGIAVATAFSVKTIAEFSKECLDLGSDLEEVQNVVDVTFPAMSKQVNSFAERAAESFGVSETMAKRFTGTFGAMAKSFGFTEQEAYSMASTLTALAGDVASFYNISQDLAYTKLKSVFSGETETLKDLGVVMTQSALDSYALANGYEKTTKSMTESEKVALRYAFIQEKLSAATGDFARTSNSWANQTRMLTLRFDSLKASIGQGLINVLTPAIQHLNAFLSTLQKVADKFAEFTAKLFGDAGEGNGGSSATEIADTLLSATESADNLTATTENTAAGIKNTAKEAKKLQNQLASFDELNILNQSDDEDDDADTPVNNIKSVVTTEMPKEISKGNKELKKTPGIISRIQNKLDKLGFGTLVEKFNKAGQALQKQIEKYNFGEALLKAVQNAISFVISALNLGAGIALPLFVALDVPGIVFEVINTISQLFETLGQIINAITPGIENFVNIGLVPIATWLGEKIKDVLQFSQEQLKKIGDWVADHEEMFTNLGTQLGEVTAKIWKLLEPIADTAWESFKKVMSELVDIVLKLAEKLGKLTEKISEAWNALYNFLDKIGVIKAVGDTFIWVANAIGDAVSQVFQTIGTAIGGAIDVLGCFADLITGVFTGDVNKIQGALTNLGQTLWKTMQDPLLSIGGNVGGVLPALNTIYKKPSFNNFMQDPSSFKWGREGVHKFATGGLVKAPMLAMVGDNPGASTDPEVISPLSKLQGMLHTGDTSEQDTTILTGILNTLVKIYELLVKIYENGGSVYEFIAELDGHPLFKEVVRRNEMYKKRHGGKSAFASAGGK